MKLRELLQQMQAVQKSMGTSQPFICGGTPRDRYLKHVEKISDVDITTGDKSVQLLSQELGAALSKEYNVVTKTFDDGHSAIHLGNFKMDFSSNFNVEGIEAILTKMGIKDITEMKKEMFSRDFTCNALLLSLDLRMLLDPTDRGIKDMKEKKIRTCLEPALTLTSNRNRVIRAVYLASKLGFDIDDSIIEFVKKNPGSVKISTPTSLAEKVNEAFTLDGDRAAHNISKMNIWQEIPITDIVRPYYLKKDQLVSKKAYFQGGGGVNEPSPNKKKYKSDPAIVNQTRFKEPFYRNYDLYDIPGFEHIGPGAGWHSMQKYKSVEEFLKAKRKKMKDKYEADDSWIQDSGEITKKNPMKARAALLEKLVKTARMPGMGLFHSLQRKFGPIDHKCPFCGKNKFDVTFDCEHCGKGGPVVKGRDNNDIDFPIDDQIESTIDHDGDLSNHSLEMGGMGMPLRKNDSEEKDPADLDFGHREEEDSVASDPDLIELLTDKYLAHEARTQQNGLPDGLDHSEEEDTQTTQINPDYGTLGPESTMYEDKWNI